MERVFVGEYLSGGGLDRAAVEAERGRPGSLLAQGLAMRDALLADLAALPGASVSYALGEGVPAWVPCSALALAPRPGEALIDFVRREAPRHDFVWLVAPETGGCLASLAEAVDASRWVGCTPAALRLCGSKRATVERLASHGLLTPHAFEQEAMRWVVKPDDGAGAMDTRLHPSGDAAREDAAARAHAAAHEDAAAHGLRAAHEDAAGRAQGGTRGHAAGRSPPAAAGAVVEPWVEGEALSLALLADGAGQGELLAVNRQRIDADASSGMVAYRGVELAAIGASDPRHGALHLCAAALLRALPGLRGFVGADLVWHATRGPVVIEINPRLTCAYAGLSALLGRNLAGEVLALHRTGRAGETPGLHRSGRVGEQGGSSRGLA